MARIKYYYDTESCKYERLKISTWDIIVNLLGFFCIVVILAIGIFFLSNKYFKSPIVAQLEKENQEMNFYYDLITQEVDNLNEMLASLQERDDNIYRITFEAEPIPANIRNGGVGGTNRYKEMLDKGLEREALILETSEKIENLKKKMYIQTKSYDELLDMAKNKELQLAATPAIAPVANKNLKRIASGYGYRIDPFSKARTMHKGLDFSAPSGTPVYVTGDGVVKRVEKNDRGGYGKHIDVDHGFGFVTRYGHLYSINVKKGQKIKRGELIGQVGNT
ncbi:MAG: M23 family metallopeptidase, partial [Cyclobacteriaceae bacterium]|nr:M23 family metallopeptidase [Cyclobacteriaceae bacterium]